jgi:hypothetical protein
MGVHTRKTPLANQNVPEFDKCPMCIFRGVWRSDSVVQMDFDFTPSGTAMISQSFDQSLVVLFRRIKIGVAKWMPITVTPLIRQLRVFLTPVFNSSFLFMLIRRSSRYAREN